MEVELFSLKEDGSLDELDGGTLLEELDELEIALEDVDELLEASELLELLVDELLEIIELLVDVLDSLDSKLEEDDSSLAEDDSESELIDDSFCDDEPPLKEEDG